MQRRSFERRFLFATTLKNFFDDLFDGIRWSLNRRTTYDSVFSFCIRARTPNVGRHPRSRATKMMPKIDSNALSIDRRREEPE
jgi:hypothetical protein